MAASRGAGEAPSEEQWLNVILFCVLTLSTLILALLLKSRSRGRFLLAGRVLFVTAHPDDECMFFGPAVLSAIHCGAPPYLLCLSTGKCVGWLPFAVTLWPPFFAPLCAHVQVITMGRGRRGRLNSLIAATPLGCQPPMSQSLLISMSQLVSSIYDASVGCGHNGHMTG